MLVWSPISDCIYDQFDNQCIDCMHFDQIVVQLKQTIREKDVKTCPVTQCIYDHDIKLEISMTWTNIYIWILYTLTQYTVNDLSQITKASTIWHKTHVLSIHWINANWRITNFNVLSTHELWMYKHVCYQFLFTLTFLQTLFKAEPNIVIG